VILFKKQAVHHLFENFGLSHAPLSQQRGRNGSPSFGVQGRVMSDFIFTLHNS